MTRSAVTAIFLLLVATNASLATSNCQTQGHLYRVDQSDRITYESAMDGKGCRYVFAAFQKAVIMKQPANGKLSQIGEYSFIYVPNPGFTGKDNYVIYLCGTNRRGSGCSRLSYNATVR